jgi:hypothetical protein
VLRGAQADAIAQMVARGVRIGALQRIGRVMSPAGRFPWQSRAARRCRQCPGDAPPGRHRVGARQRITRRRVSKLAIRTHRSVGALRGSRPPEARARTGRRALPGHGGKSPGPRRCGREGGRHISQRGSRVNCLRPLLRCPRARDASGIFVQWRTISWRQSRSAVL